MLTKVDGDHGHMCVYFRLLLKWLALLGVVFLNAGAYI